MKKYNIKNVFVMMSCINRNVYKNRKKIKNGVIDISVGKTDN